MIICFPGQYIKVLEFENETELIDFINENKNAKTLIHCYIGSSRSATLVVLYLVYYKMYSITDAIKFVEEKCYRVNINVVYINELYEYTNEQI